MRSKTVLSCGFRWFWALALAWVGVWGASRAAGQPPAVAIVRGDDPAKMVAEAVELLGGIKQFLRDGQKVVLKPNLVWQPALDEKGNFVGPRKVQPGLTTDVRLVEGLSRQMLQAAKVRIAVAEGTPNDLPSLWEFLGYKKLAGELGLELVDVDASPRVKVQVAGPTPKEYQLPAVTQGCDVLVDLAVMKTHHLAGVTLGMKNLFGLLPEPKRQFHRELEDVLCDLCAARKPDLTIVEGLTALEGQGPTQGTPVKLGVLVAGRDVVAVDAVCTAIMGFEPARVRHLKRAAERGIGPIDLAGITVKGVPIDQVRRSFQHARWDAAVEIDRTDKLEAKVAKLADRTEKSRRGEGASLWFAPRHLKPDTKKYPTRESYGFYLFTHPGADKLVFHVPYQVLHEENGQAAVEEMARWIRENLGADIPMVLQPRRTPD